MAQSSQPSIDSCTQRASAALDEVSCVLTGILLWLANAGEYRSFLAWFALIPFCRALSASRATRYTYLGAYLAGVTLGLGGLDWIRTCYTGCGFSGPYTWGWLAVGQFGGLIFTATLWAGRRWVRLAGGPAALWLPLCWVAQECLRTWAVKLIDQSGGPWLRLGQSQADCLMIAQCADLAGEFGITALVAAINGALHDTLFGCHGHRARRLQSLATACAIWIAALLYGQFRLSQPVHDIRPDGSRLPLVALVGEQHLPPLPLASYFNHTAGELPAGGDAPDLIVWPELAFQHEFPAGLKHLSVAAHELRAALIMGGVRRAAGEVPQTFNSAVCMAANGTLLTIYDKQRLVPWTEFLPFGEWIAPRVPKRQYAPGQQNSVVTFPAHTKTGSYRLACAICYDVIFADLFRAAMSDVGGPPDFFVALGSECQDATGTLSAAMQRAARLRAIETRRPLVRNTSGGYSGIIDGCGRFVGPPLGTVEMQPVVLPTLPVDQRFSLYAAIGDGPAYLVAGVVAAGVALSVVSTKPRRRATFRSLSTERLSPAAVPARQNSAHCNARRLVAAAFAAARVARDALRRRVQKISSARNRAGRHAFRK